MAVVGGGGDLMVEDDLGMVLDASNVGVTFVDAPSINNPSVVLSDDAVTNDVTVCQYILPNGITGKV